MNPEIKVFNNSSELAEELANEFQRYIKKLAETNRQINIALSGGNSPVAFFRRLGSYNAIDSRKINWDIIHFFWGDERCGPPNHENSNYGIAKKYFLRSLNIPDENIHRIKGEGIPSEEAQAYSDCLMSNVPLRNSYPVFDWIFLGMGEDGHVASIFPDQLTLLFSDKICETAINPQTRQKRITMTGKVLINARRITFIITGESKRQLVKEIIEHDPMAKAYPAYYIKPVGGKMDWYLDRQAAILLNQL
jgi:6-phosphogluconolactonase